MSASKKEKRTPEQTRDLILSTAIVLFTKKGYFNTSVHDIKAEAEISIGSIYHHFKSKEEIAVALRQKMLDFLRTSFEEIQKEFTDTQDALKEIIRFLFRETQNSPEAMEFILHAKHKEFVPDEIPICSSAPFKLSKELIEKGILEKVIRKGDPFILSACYFGGAIRMIHLYLDGVYQGKLEDAFEEVSQSSWNAVKAN